MDEFIRLSNIQANFQEICRTCLLEKDNLQTIFHIVDLLKECTSIQIDLEDNLPKLICVECTNKLNTSFEFRKQCEVSQKILFQLREFGVTPIKLENNGLNSQLHEIEQLEKNDVHIKSEDSYNTNEDNSYACDENNKFNINNEFSYVNINTFRNVDGFIETTANENKNNLDLSKKQNNNFESSNTITEKNSLSCDFDDQPLNKRLKIENSDIIHENDNFAIPVNSKLLRKNKTKSIKKSNEQKDKKKLEIKKDDNAIQNGLACPQCKKCFELGIDLEIHILKHQKYNDFNCPKCSKTFGNEKNLKHHLNIHMINKPYKCNLCNKTFASSCDRKRHIIRIHTGEKPIVCSVCGARFADISRLSSHMKCHTEKKFACTMCSKSFSLGYTLREHIKTHTGEKPYLCTVCGRRFSKSCNVTKHMRIHTGEMPYPCTKCDKKFRLSEQLKMHDRIHTGIKPYGCKICGKEFARAESLKLHNRLHTGERPYACDICGKKFVSRGNFRKHNKRVHIKSETENENL